MRSRLFLFLAVIVSIFMSVSCHHKDLCYAHPHTSKLRVVYDWSDASDATATGMCVFFYSTDNEGVYHRFDFSNTHGGEIELPVGNYVIVTYNNDTELVKFSSTNLYEGHKAYTRTGDLLEPLYGNGVTSTASTSGNQRVVISPDGLWGCHATDVHVTEHGVKYTFTRAGEDATNINPDDQTITLYPHDMLCHYSYEVRNVRNIEHISKISGAISGMAGSMTLSDENLDSESITIPFGGKVDIPNGKITGEFLTFGHKDTNPDPHKMSFYIIMDNGDKYSVTDASNLDVTSQVHSAPDQKHVHIVIDGLKLPTPLADDDGFSPSVDDWGIVEEDLNV